MQPDRTRVISVFLGRLGAGPYIAPLKMDGVTDSVKRRCDGLDVEGRRYGETSHNDPRTWSRIKKLAKQRHLLIGSAPCKRGAAQLMRTDNAFVRLAPLLTQGRVCHLVPASPVGIPGPYLPLLFIESAGRAPKQDVVGDTVRSICP